MLLLYIILRDFVKLTAYVTGLCVRLFFAPFRLLFRRPRRTWNVTYTAPHTPPDAR